MIRPNDHDTTPKRTGDGRFVALETEDGDVVLYDQHNRESWIQSDVSMPAEKVR